MNFFFTGIHVISERNWRSWSLEDNIMFLNGLKKHTWRPWSSRDPPNQVLEPTRTLIYPITCLLPRHVLPSSRCHGVLELAFQHQTDSLIWFTLLTNDIKTPPTSQIHSEARDGNSDSFFLCQIIIWLSPQIKVDSFGTQLCITIIKL